MEFLIHETKFVFILDTKNVTYYDMRYWNKNEFIYNIMTKGKSTKWTKKFLRVWERCVFIFYHRLKIVRAVQKKFYDNVDTEFLVWIVAYNIVKTNLKFIRIIKRNTIGDYKISSYSIVTLLKEIWIKKEKKKSFIVRCIFIPSFVTTCIN